LPVVTVAATPLVTGRVVAYDLPSVPAGNPGTPSVPDLANMSLGSPEFRIDVARMVEVSSRLLPTYVHYALQLKSLYNLEFHPRSRPTFSVIFLAIPTPMPPDGHP